MPSPEKLDPRIHTGYPSFLEKRNPKPSTGKKRQEEEEERIGETWKGRTEGKTGKGRGEDRKGEWKGNMKRKR